MEIVGYDALKNVIISEWGCYQNTVNNKIVTKANPLDYIRFLDNEIYIYVESRDRNSYSKFHVIINILKDELVIIKFEVNCHISHTVSMKFDDNDIPLYSTIDDEMLNAELDFANRIKGYCELYYTWLFSKPGRSHIVTDTDKFDPVSAPKHYTNGNMECIDAMMSTYGPKKVFDFCLLNAFKYRWRFKDKNGIEDLDKAKWYMTKACSILEANVSVFKECNEFVLDVYLLDNISSSVNCAYEEYKMYNNPYQE